MTITEYLAMNETELLFELARGLKPGPDLQSPESRLAEARAYVAGLWDPLQKLVCPHRDLVDLPEFELATGLVGILSYSFGASLATILAVYVAKRGIRSLCPETR